MQKRVANQSAAILAQEKIVIISQNVQGLKDLAKLETIINEVNKRGIYAFLVQESWLEGDYDVQQLTHGITFIHHGPPKQGSRRDSGGVGIILSEEATRN
jgi:hypothetical protein